MSIVLQSTGGGSVTLQEPSTASTFTQTLPSGTGTVVVSGINSAITAGTAVSASGTSVPFTNIPSWVRRITVLFNGTQTNGSSNYLIQIGTGGSPTTSGYLSTSTRVWTSVNVYNSTAGFIYGIDNSSMIMSGASTISNISGNTWIFSGLVAQTNAGGTQMTMQSGGTVTLGGTLNYLRLTTVNGTDTFTAGTVNILYE